MFWQVCQENEKKTLFFWEIFTIQTSAWSLQHLHTLSYREVWPKLWQRQIYLVKLSWIHNHTFSFYCFWNITNIAKTFSPSSKSLMEWEDFACNFFFHIKPKLMIERKTNLHWRQQPHFLVVSLLCHSVHFPLSSHPPTLPPRPLLFHGKRKEWLWSKKANMWKRDGEKAFNKEKIWQL